MTPLDESNRQFIDAWKTLIGRMPAGTTTDLGGLVAVFGNIPVSFFNVSFLTAPVRQLDDLRRRVNDAIAYGSASGVPWFLALCEEWLPEGADEVCRQAGLGQALRLTGMAADELVAPRRPQPDLGYTRVADETTAGSIAEINTLAYDMPLELGSHLAMTSLWPGDAYAYLGEMNGVAVTCAATLPVDGRLYVAWVATRPGHHRKGYAEAVMRHSLRVASETTGLQRTILHATDAGLPVYEAMGYVVTSRFGMYTPMEAGAEHA